MIGLLSRIKSTIVRARNAPSKISSLVRDVDNEFDIHIQECIDDLVDSGMSIRAAQVEAARRFGDISQHRADLLELSVARSGRPLLIAGIVTIGAIGVACFLGVQNISKHNRQQTLITQLQDELHLLRATFTIQSDSPRIPMAQDVRFVAVDGAVASPKVWAIGRRESISIGKLLERSGWLTQHATGFVYAVKMKGNEPAGEPIRLDLTGEVWPNAIHAALDGTYVIYAEPKAASTTAEMLLNSSHTNSVSNVSHLNQ